MNRMLTCSLNSGSNGNCIYVEKGSTRLLLDAGISGKQAELRLRELGRDIRDVTALFLSHDHRDHTYAAGVYQRKFHLPVHMTSPTYERIQEGLGAVSDVRFFRAGERVAIGDLDIETIRTPHDGVDGVIFVVTDGRRRIGIFTDLGHPFDALADALRDMDFVYMESNYDPEMLECSSYPEDVKARIRGSGGHLSNGEAAELVRECSSDRLRGLVLSHLSEENNHSSLALQAHRWALKRDIALSVASRYERTGMFRVG
ncbi:MAG: MBL fold metallo-hydrolase [Planctomycetes bacterium]|nr:MBL fold metallo-hydrolase [Planctomycetota bacterium]